MSKYIQSEDGYIVFEGGYISSPMSYGSSEKWFQSYDEAMSYAMYIVRKHVEELRTCPTTNSVVVFEGTRELLNQTHSVPGERRVFFRWNNY